MAGVLAGTVVRVEQYASDRSLWLDEAMLSLNLIDRSLSQLAKPLAFGQGAPLGWLWIQRMVVVMFGSSEYALRAIPLVSGIGALVLLTLIARRVIGAWAGAATALMVAAAPMTVRYSAEVKQYSSDLFIASLLVLVTLIVQERSLAARWVWSWGALAAISVWLSHSALVVVPACAVGLGVDLLLRRQAANLGWLVAAVVGWAMSVGVLYFVSLRSLAGDPFLRGYWAAAMAPRPFGVHSFASWVGRIVPALYRNPGQFEIPLLAVALTAAGFAILLKRDRITLAATLLATVGLAVTAAGLDRYPLSGRLALYLLVVIILPLSAVVDWCVRRLPVRPALGLCGLALVAIVLVSPVLAAASYVPHPFATPDTRDVLRFVRDHRQRGDQLWVQWPEIPVARFYAAPFRLQPDAYLGDGGGAGSGGCSGQPPTTAAHGGRVWAVFGYRLSTAPPNERAAIVATLSQTATLRTQAHRAGAVAYLYDFGVAPSPAPARPPAALQCLIVSPVSAPVVAPR